jgi:hypothetical protein
MTGSDIGTACDAVLTMQDLGEKIPKITLDKTTLHSDDFTFPCGLIANISQMHLQVG